MKHPTREAENRRVDRPVAGPKLGSGAILCLALGSCAIEEARPVTWNFSLECRADADRAELVELRVGKGECPIREPVIFETVTSTWDSPGSRQQGFPAGRYAFQGTAWDANGQPVASHCQSVQLPVTEAISLNLQGASACGSSEDKLEDSGPDAGPWDSETTLDAGVQSPDAGPASDAGSGSDAGSVPDAGLVSDAGSVSDAGGACPDDSDRDTDGVADCMDACPDDAAKVIEGQCGCGLLETDQDGDGTANCVDNCPVDGNKTEPGTCGCNPKTTLLGGERLLVGESLCGPRDDSVRLVMGEDGNLQLRVDDAQVWTSDGTTDSMGQTGSQAKLQMDGNLVIRTVSDAAVWSSKTNYAVMGVTTLAVNADGTVTISREGNVVWTVP